MQRVVIVYRKFRARLIEVLYNSNYYERFERPWNVRLLLVVLFVLSVSLFKILLSSRFGYTALPYILYFPAIVLSVWYAGLTAGIISVLLSALVANYLFVYPFFDLSFMGDGTLPEAIIFIVEGLLIVWLVDMIQSVIHIAKLREHRQAEAELRFTRLADNAPSIIWRTDKDHNIIYWNNLFKDFIPFELLEVGPVMRIFEKISYEKKNEALTEMRMSMNKQVPFQIEICLKTIDGRQEWILMRAEPFVSPTGVFSGFVGSGINITERKLMEKRKSQFISITSHELKTPLTSIKAFIQLLERMETLKKHKDVQYYFSKVVKQVDIMTVFINDLLDLSRIERDSFYIRKEQFNIKELIYSTVKDFKSTHYNNKFKIKGVSQIFVLGDKNRLTQVFVNLLENAVKYSPEKSTIEIGMQTFKSTVRVYVKDDGYGIPLKDQKKIFKLFVQGSDGQSSESGGLGLGLYISKKIIEKHGGNIWVKSSPGKGSTFYFSLPLPK